MTAAGATRWAGRKAMTTTGAVGSARRPCVLLGMLRLTSHDLEILGPVVTLNPVLMTNDLPRSKRSAKHFFSNHSMLVTTVLLPVLVVNRASLPIPSTIRCFAGGQDLAASQTATSSWATQPGMKLSTAQLANLHFGRSPCRRPCLPFCRSCRVFPSRSPTLPVG
jgi:hypothetical protein